MESNDRIPDHGGEDNIRLCILEFLNDRPEFTVSERDIFFSGDFAAELV